jgi:ubiquinone/menaquinone biosynthesis C-methylase UbiE
MNINHFYERAEVVHEVVEAKRSAVCYAFMVGLVTKRTNKVGDKRILDIGCGDGSFAIRLRKYSEVFGIDISQKAIDLARKAGLSAYRTDISREKLPFGSEYFDVVYMGDVIEHLLNPDFAICEVLRVLKQGGFLVLSTPNLASWLNRLLLFLGLQPRYSEVSTVKQFGRFGRQDFAPVGHLRLFTYRALRQFLMFYHFNIVKVEGVASEGLPRALGHIDRAVSRIPSLASSIIVVVQKGQ